MITRKIAAFAFIFAIVALAIGLSGCERIPPPPVMDDAEMPPMMDEGITIGVALGLTGANAEPYGIPMQRGLELAREELNMLDGVNITFITEDALSTVEGAKAAVQSLVDQSVPAIVGIGISTHLKEAFPIANDAGVVAFSPISSAAGINTDDDFIFRTGLRIDILNSNGTMVTHEELEYKKVALIYDEADEYSTSSNTAFEKTLAELGVEILTVETFQTGDTDFSAQLTRIADMEPDTLFVSAISSEMTQIITQARDKDAGLPAAVRLVVPDVTAVEIQEVGDDAAEGIITFSGWFGMADTPGNSAFVQAYTEKHGEAPGPWAAQAYTTLHILANAIMNAGSTDSTAIRDALAQTMDLPTILGNFSFDPNGEAIYDPIVFIVKDGELQLFETVVPEMVDQGISIGMVVSLTGDDAEPYGLPMQRGFELAREEINALGVANLTFVTEDDQSSEEGAIAAVQQLVDQDVPAIVGIAISDYLEDAFPIAQENGVVAFSSVSTAAGLSSIGDYVFRAGLAVDRMNPSGVMATHEKLGYTKVALIYDASDTYSTSSNEEIKKALEAAGVEILTEETIQRGDTDFSTQLTKIMSVEPDALFVSALSVDMVQVVIQAGELGIPETIQLIVPDLTITELQQIGDAAEGAIAFTGWTSLSTIPESQAFVHNYQAKYGIEPEPWAAMSYATLYILADAIVKAQSTDSAAIRDALAQTMDFSTILGNFSFDPNGEAVYDATVLMVKDGQLQLFE